MNLIMCDYYLQKININKVTGIDYIDFSLKEFIEFGDFYEGETVKIDNNFYKIVTKEKMVHEKRDVKYFIGNKEIKNNLGETK